MMKAATAHRGGDTTARITLLLGVVTEIVANAGMTGIEIDGPGEAAVEVASNGRTTAAIATTNGTATARGGRDDQRYAPNSSRDFQNSTSSSKNETPSQPKPKKAAPPAASAAAPGGEEMIIVNINDRLGTKAAIPCFASDRVKEFKIMVAARIGREPHEILLKRQGERPFKDHLTLEDYGVSNGVQLDLEVDTGD
jgi:hypothetical protein